MFKCLSFFDNVSHANGSDQLQVARHVVQQSTGGIHEWVLILVIDDHPCSDQRFSVIETEISPMLLSFCWCCPACKAARLQTMQHSQNSKTLNFFDIHIRTTFSPFQKRLTAKHSPLHLIHAITNIGTAIFFPMGVPS